MVRGIDVSHWSGTMDWAKAVSAGVRFAWIKATESLSYVDPQFKRNWQDTDGKLPRGAYHFWRAAGDPLKQARHFADTVGDDKGDIPPMLDIEDVYATKMAAKVSADITACAAEIKRLFGKKPVIYTAKWYWDTWVSVPTCLNAYDLAVAHYTAATAPLMPRGWSEWRIWQYSADKNGKGREFGGQCDDMDLDKFNGDEVQFQAWAGVVSMPLTLEDKVAKLWAAHPELH